MAEKQSNKDRLKEITDSIENGIKELFESEKYKNYLRTMSRFHKYSVNNTIPLSSHNHEITQARRYGMDTYTASDMDIRAVDPAALVDIRDVKVNTALPKRERILDFIRQIGNPYCYRHGKYVVRVSFTDTDISLEDRLEAYIRTKG